ncbi:hypothetical protein CEXT_164601 [Caerostris extrusa]|uniref:Uncharacterized protein n=1 Tax=Caerostris extrusa TaxID=172846 RepID=A0AAV4SKV6_CAEEX|nr:hypothetical protein CEXT_164601 [Caerostris extrusa]
MQSEADQWSSTNQPLSPADSKAIIAGLCGLLTAGRPETLTDTRSALLGIPTLFPAPPNQPPLRIAPQEDEGRGVSSKCAHNSLVISSYICKSSGSVPRRDDQSQFRFGTRQGMAFRNEVHEKQITSENWRLLRCS